ncbi:MAG: phosphotransferase family protein [Halobacteriota archaeon]
MTADYLARLVDEAALRSYLTECLGAASEFSIRRHRAGHSNETLFLTWGERELVLRRPPPGETAETAHDVLREFAVIDALQDSPVRVPTTVLACDDPDVIGAEFYLMGRERGRVIREAEPERFATREHRRRVGEELLDRLVEIHRVDPVAVGLDAFGYPEGFTERQVRRWSEQLMWAFQVTAGEREVPALYEVMEWLYDAVPDDHPHTLVHGDYKLDNVMFGPGLPPTIASIFDWEMSTLGDPFTDLGWLLSYWWDPKDPDPPASTGSLSATFMARPGYPTRRALVERYERAMDLEFEHERFYRTLAVYKLAALGEMFYRRHLEGNADDPMYPKMREGVPALADRAMRIIDGEEPL